MNLLEQIKERLEKMKSPFASKVNNEPYDLAISDVQALLPSIIQEVVEGVKKDYIKWVFSNSYDRKYDGDTPFGKWKDEAEVEDMRNWK